MDSQTQSPLFLHVVPVPVVHSICFNGGGVAKAQEGKPLLSWLLVSETKLPRCHQNLACPLQEEGVGLGCPFWDVGLGADVLREHWYCGRFQKPEACG